MKQPVIQQKEQTCDTIYQARSELYNINHCSYLVEVVF